MESLLKRMPEIFSIHINTDTIMKFFWFLEHTLYELQNQ